MTFPKLVTVKRWLPFLGGGLLGAWMLGLVIASLLLSQDEEPPQPTPHGTGARESGSACVVMPDGLSICDELPSG